MTFLSTNQFIRRSLPASGAAAIIVYILLYAAWPAAGSETKGAYRSPDNPDVVRLLTAGQIPEVILHAASRRAALLHRETLVPIERIARPYLGLAGYWFDPSILASGYDARIEKVELIDVLTGALIATWAPAGPAELDHVAFSPDGRRLSAVTFRSGRPRLVLFDIDAGRERVLPVALNPAFGNPCAWTGSTSLLCRIVTDEQAQPPKPVASPNMIEHSGKAAPTRTYSNLLRCSHDEALFEHYFGSTLARVGIDGNVRRLEASTGLLARVLESPDGRYALVIRLNKPYSHFLRASYFPRQVEIWDIEKGVRLEARGLPQQGAVTPTDAPALPEFAWKSGAFTALGWIETAADGRKRWLALVPPFDGMPREITRIAGGISSFDWTSAGTPLFSQHDKGGTVVRFFVVRDDGTSE